MVDGVGVETDTFAARRGRARVRRASCVIVIALIVDSTAADRRFFPTRVTFDRHAGRTHHLIRREVQRHVVRRKLSIELTRRIQRMVLPAVPVVDHHFRIPLREIEPPATPALPPR